MIKRSTRNANSHSDTLSYTNGNLWKALLFSTEYRLLILYFFISFESFFFLLSPVPTIGGRSRERTLRNGNLRFVPHSLQKVIYFFTVEKLIITKRGEKKNTTLLLIDYGRFKLGRWGRDCSHGPIKINSITDGVAFVGRLYFKYLKRRTEKQNVWSKFHLRYSNNNYYFPRDAFKINQTNGVEHRWENTN